MYAFKCALGKTSKQTYWLGCFSDKCIQRCFSADYQSIEHLGSIEKRKVYYKYRLYSQRTRFGDMYMLDMDFKLDL